MKVFTLRGWLLGWFPLSLLIAGCANQGEGERCDTVNYQADCEEGLQCVPVNNQGRPQTLCCPIPPRQVTVAACIGGAVITDAGSSDAPILRRDASDGSTSDRVTPGDVQPDTMGQDRINVDVREEPVVDVRPDRPSADVPPEGSTEDAEGGPRIDVSEDASHDVTPDISLDVSSDPTDDVPLESGPDTTVIDAPLPDALPDAPNADSAG